jgi:hypothetical protein
VQNWLSLGILEELGFEPASFDGVVFIYSHFELLEQQFTIKLTIAKTEWVCDFWAFSRNNYNIYLAD